MSWSQKAWEKSIPIYKRIISHPFIKELMNGSLPKEKFGFYIQQDALYLQEYGKVMSGIASRLDEPEQAGAFLRFAVDTVEVENALHATFRNELNISKGEAASPSCMLYTSFMQNILHTRPVFEAVAAVLPCFTVYMNVGKFIYSHQTADANSYRDWINTYSGDLFASSVMLAEKICDHLAHNCSEIQQDKMLEHYLFATKLEWMFWESAYKMEQWEI